ncbi:MAG: restriction endonuclease, partial [Methanosarcinales archaeon]
EYALTFYKQYIGFQLKDPKVIKNEKITFDDLVKISRENNLKYVEEHIIGFNKLLESESWIRIWRVAQSAPNSLCFEANKRVAVILDEFQCLDELVYIDEAKTLLDNSITPSYHSVCTDIRAPMLVSGSLVTIVTRKVMSGPLRGRFGKIKLGLLEFDDALALVFKLSEKYNLPVTFETAKLIVEISGRNPFYINSAFASSMQNKDLSSIKGVEEVYKFEVTNEEGRIYEFWDKHFKRNLRLLNKDPPDNFGLTKQIIFYILKYQDKKVSYEDIARKFGRGIHYALEKLEDLMEMDLVEESSYGFVYGIKDTMLAKVLRVKFGGIIEKIDDLIVRQKVESELEKEVERLTKEKTSLQSSYNNLIGEAAEVMLKRIITKFNNQIVDGKLFFNYDGKITLIKFNKKPSTTLASRGFKSNSIQFEWGQIDIYAKKGNNILIVESKNWNTKVGIAYIRDFIEKLQRIKKEEPKANITGWFYSKKGFTKPARNLLKQHNIWYSAQEDLVELLKFLEP